METDTIPQIHASVSIGPLNVHISLQGVTEATTLEQVAPLLEQTIPSLTKAIAKSLTLSLKTELDRLREA